VYNSNQVMVTCRIPVWLLGGESSKQRQRRTPAGSKSEWLSLLHVSRVPVLLAAVCRYLHHHHRHRHTRRFSAKLHYTDTGYEHHQRAPPTDELTTIYNLLYNTTNGQNFATSQHLDMALRCGKFVVELL